MNLLRNDIVGHCIARLMLMPTTCGQSSVDRCVVVLDTGSAFELGVPDATVGPRGQPIPTADVEERGPDRFGITERVANKVIQEIVVVENLPSWGLLFR